MFSTVDANGDIAAMGDEEARGPAGRECGRIEEVRLHGELSSGTLYGFSSRFTATYRIAALAASDRF
jgi:hypothetical protein